MSGGRTRRYLARWGWPAAVIAGAAVQLVSTAGAGWLVVVPLAIILAVVLAFAREHPRWAGVAAIVCQVGFSIASALHYGFPGLVIGLALIAAVYTVARRCALPESAWWVGAILGLATVRALVGWSGTEDIIPDTVLALAAGAGYLNRNRAAVEAARYEALRTAEREQIARDVHDVISHGLSSIAVYAEGAAFVADPDSPEGQALATIRDTARATLAETREVVTRLRDVPDGPGRPHTLAELPGLLAASVPPARIEVEGDPAALPEHVSRALYRIVQESLTNVRRHARGATGVDVVLRIGAEDVRLEVSDDGAAAPDGHPGYGLRGIRERAALLGGSASAGQRSSGGWVVSVEIPLRNQDG